VTIKSEGAVRRNASPALRARLTGALALALSIPLLPSTPVLAADGGSLDGLTFEALAYFDYSNGQAPLADGLQTDYNRFKLTRGYFTMRNRFNDWMGMRLTMDLTQDDSGDYKRREKYFYAELKPRDAGFLTNMKAEIGIGHMPWLDFEEHINPYRCQGTMAVERAGTFNSADVGVSLQGYFGEKMDDAKERTGNSHYAGRVGSWHVGVYNGGGYHAEEMNENKALEGRLTFRPLADALPGLQLSYLGIIAKGNQEPVAEAVKADDGIPDYNVHLGMLSFEHPVLTLTAQFFTTDGNAKGAWVDGEGGALKTQGWSGFANVKLDGAGGRWNLFGRYDHFDADSDDVIAAESAYDMVLGGFAYDLYKGNMLLVAYESTTYDADSGGKGEIPSIGENLGDESRIQIVYQIKL
jgi:hypothetical protein